MRPNSIAIIELDKMNFLTKMCILFLVNYTYKSY